MNRHKLANDIAASHFGLGGFTLEFQILRRQADRDKRKNVSFVANASTSVNHAMPVKSHAISQSYLIANDYVGPNETIGSDSRVGTDDGGRMHLHGRNCPAF